LFFARILTSCFFLNFIILFSMRVLVSFYESPCILRLVWCGFRVLQLPPHVLIVSMVAISPCEAMLHVFTLSFAYIRLHSCMPIQVHVHSNCVANCFTS
jgi:hypothetical protein